MRCVQTKGWFSFSFFVLYVYPSASSWHQRTKAWTTSLSKASRCSDLTHSNERTFCYLTSVCPLLFYILLAANLPSLLHLLLRVCLSLSKFQRAFSFGPSNTTTKTTTTVTWEGLLHTTKRDENACSTISLLSIYTKLIPLQIVSRPSGPSSTPSSFPLSESHVYTSILIKYFSLLSRSNTWFYFLDK